MEIKLKTLTPLWTGGVEQTSDRLHETGLIGSLRWWYEALVRGLGGFACDPTSHTCEYDPKIGPKSMCAACYLFGTTGWARLFRLLVLEDEIRQEPLHFYTSLPTNKRWLASMFGGERRNNRIGGMTVPFGVLRLKIVGRGVDETYALSQLTWVVEFVVKKGGLGAKLQHGFGQVSLPSDVRNITAQSEQMLKERLLQFRKASNDEQWPSYQRFFSLSFSIAANHWLWNDLMADHIGDLPTRSNYVPCTFDLRYKGSVVKGKQIGFRQWLMNKGWRRYDTNILLGETRARRDDERLGSRVFFGMPWQNEKGDYLLHVFGFLPPNIDVVKVENEVKFYIENLFGKEGGG